MQYLEKIGSGAFSDAFLCKKAGVTCVVKVSNSPVRSKRELREIEAEIKMLKILAKSKYVVNMKFCDTKLEYPIIGFEFLEESLYDVIKRFKKDKKLIPIPIIKLIARGILLGLRDLSRHDILHCDLKPENIMFRRKGCWDSLKLIDFGNSIFIKKYKNNVIQTRHYKPPEAIIRADISLAADMWAFGCILYELFTNTVLFDPHRDNNITINSAHMAMMVHVFGMPSKAFLKRGEKSMHYFTPDFKLHKFHYLIEPQTDLKQLLAQNGHADEPQDILNKKCSILKKILIYEPEKRISYDDCMTLIKSL